jgi:endonuclease/exonuclease/phosphatase family metal-dependent hydrolase
MLKILTFNASLQDIRIFGRSLYRPVGLIKQRLNLLPSALKAINADIVLLQEVFHRDFQDKLYKPLASTYPYVTGFANSGIKLRLGNELIILSKYPLHITNLIRFDTATREELRFTSKGFFHTIVEYPELGEINILNYHMTAGGKNAHPEDSPLELIRQHQIDQLLNYTCNLKNLIMGGDLNAGPHTSQINYKQVVDSRLIDICQPSNTMLYSWDPENPLVKEGIESHLPPQCIEHIFMDSVLFNQFSQFNSKIVLNEKICNHDKKSYPLSDHYGITVCCEF